MDPDPHQNVMDPQHCYIPGKLFRSSFAVIRRSLSRESLESPQSSSSTGGGGGGGTPAPMRLSDMLKRKRVSSRKSSRKSSGGTSGSRDDLTASSPAVLTSTPGGGAGPAPGRRSRLSSASSILERLHPSRWVRASPPLIQHPLDAPSGSSHHPASSTPTHQHTKDKAKVPVILYDLAI